MNPYTKLWHGLTDAPKKRKRLYNLYYGTELIVKSQPYPVCVAEKNKRQNSNYQLSTFKIIPS